MTSSPHDALFRFTFSQPEHAIPLIRSRLPAQLAHRIDWSSLRLCPGSFVDSKLAWRHTDLLFSALVDGRDALIYVLLEHQSTPDPLMPFRVLHYLVRILDDFLKKDDSATRLPAIVPIVVYHGETPWKAPLHMLDLFDLDADLAAALHDHLPQLRLLIDDLGRQDDQALRARALTHAGELTAHCLAELPFHPDPLSLFHRWAGLMRALLGARSGADALAAVLRYALLVTDLPPELLQQTLALEVGTPAVEALMTAAEKLTEEAKKLALAQGKAEGRAEGKAEKAAEIVLKLLSLRFGKLPAKAKKHVQEASVAELDRLAERVLKAKTLDDVFKKR